MKKNILLFHIIPGALFAVLILLFSVSLTISRTRPVIYSLEPARVSPGDSMVINGRNFGISRSKGRVYLDNFPLTAQFVESWNDEQIKLRVPPVKSSGLVSVETSGGRSRGSLFVLSDRVPALAAGAFLPGKPFLSQINSSSFRPGELIILKGDKMGLRKKNSRILVSISGEAPDGVLDSPDESNYMTVPEEYIYSWQNDGVSFFLPQNARSGPVYLFTPSGYSNPVSIEVIQPEGLTHGEPVGRKIRQDIEISHIAALPGNGLVLNIPRPVNRPGQILLEGEEKSLLVLKNLSSGDDLSLEYEYGLESRSVNYSLSQSSIPRSYTNGLLVERWTADSPGIPASDFRRTALAVINREAHPFRIASLLYDYVLWRLSPDLENPETDPSLWLTTRRADSLGYASLFTALCRSVDVPARVVSGVWAPPGAETAVSHHWAEVYLSDVGWIPVDTAAGDGLLDYLLEEGSTSPGGFGQLDSGYISFSRGEIDYPDVMNRVRTGSRASYSRQNTYAEWLGNLDSCSINWKDIAIMAQQ